MGIDDIFGPWTPPGTGGKSTTTTGDPGATTPAILDGVPFWDTSTEAYIQVARPGPWNRCKLGGIQLPGVVTVTGKGPQRKVDVKDAAGKQDATVTAKGWSPPDLTITMILWTPTHLQEWRAARALLLDKSGKSDALDIENPVAEDAGIRSVLLKCPGLIEEGQVKGTKKVVLEVMKFVTKPKATGTGTPGKKSGSSGSAQKILDAQNAYMGMGGDANSLDDWLSFLAQNGLPHDYPPPVGYPKKAPPDEPNPAAP